MITTFILAGGFGTRLKEISGNQAKVLTPINGKPVIWHQLTYLKKEGIKNIVLMLHFDAEKIKNYVLSEFPELNFTFNIEKTPLSSAGALAEFTHKQTTSFLVLYGDVMLDVDLKSLINFHTQHQADITIASHPNDHPFDSDILEINSQNKIIKVHAKPHKKEHYLPNLVSAGMYIFEAKVLKFIPKNKKNDFGRDLFPLWPQKLTMFAYNTAEYLKDMGTKERHREVSLDLKSGKINRLNKKNKRPAIFIDRDGVINADKYPLAHHNNFELLPGVIEAIKKINKSDFLAILITNQPILAKGFCSFSDLQLIHNKMETLLGNEGAKLDAIYFCPHHPETGFEGEVKELKIQCACRKPAPGMIFEAQNQFNIDLKNSFMIGDHDRDIECGKNAGVHTIAVFESMNADVCVSDLNEAITYILKN